MTNAIKCMFILTLYQSSKCASWTNETRLERRQMEGYVVGGDYTNINEYPHAVYLQVMCDGNAWTCGASILNQRIIITAAHCLHMCNLGNRMDFISIFAGSSNIRQTKYSRYARAFETHRYYEERQVLNDIGLILTDQNIPLGQYTKRIIIKSIFPQEYVAYVAGWGSTDDETGVISTRLKHVVQKLRSRNTCQRVGNLHKGMFCAGDTGYYEDHPAEGDSGSALITKSFTGIGLVSFRVGAYPALLIYTNITFYHDWVIQKAKQLYCY